MNLFANIIKRYGVVNRKNLPFLLLMNFIGTGSLMVLIALVVINSASKGDKYFNIIEWSFIWPILMMVVLMAFAETMMTRLVLKCEIRKREFIAAKQRKSSAN